MRSLEEFRYLCHCFFNGQIPIKRFLYRYNGKKYSKRAFFEYFKDLAGNFYKKSMEGHTITKKLSQPDYEKNNVLKKISQIYKNNPYFDYLILGSYADNTYTSESDVDDIVILKKEVFESYQKFYETKRVLDKLSHYYQQVDPVQHHGHWIFTEFDLKNYDQSIMPISVLERAVSIGRDLDLKFSIDKPASQQGFIKIFDINLNDARSWVKDLYGNKSNLFYLKLILSSSCLLIPLLFQIKGEILDKATAINRADELLDERALKVLNWTTKIRHDWDKLPGIRFNYSKLRMLSLFEKNRHKLEQYARNQFPTLNYKEIPHLENLNQKDFEYYFDFLERLKNEAVK